MFGALPYRESKIMFSEANVDLLKTISCISEHNLEKFIKITIEQEKLFLCIEW